MTGNKKEWPGAFRYFHNAARKGHILGFYRLAEMYLLGMGLEEPNCQLALAVI